MVEIVKTEPSLLEQLYQIEDWTDFTALVLDTAKRQPTSLLLRNRIAELAEEKFENGSQLVHKIYRDEVERKAKAEEEAECRKRAIALGLDPDTPRWFVERMKQRAAAKAQEAQPKPEPQPEPEPKKATSETPQARVMLPAVIPPTSPPVTWDDAIEAMNDRHAIIDNFGGKTLIAGWEPSQIDPARMVVVFQNKESFLLRYSNRYAIIDVPDGRGGTRQSSMPLGQWWLSHRQRRQYRGVTFLPAGPKVVNDCLNLWRGWGVEPNAGDWSLIREHIELVLAGGNAEFADYIVRWIAWSIQNPAAQAEVALVLIGAKGAGKGTLVRCLQRIFGAHAFQVTSREEVIGKFNGHLQDCILFIADEAYWGGDKRCVGRLQGMITEPKLPIERKGVDVFEVRNFLHIVMLAEPGWVIPAGRYERRYAAIAVSTARIPPALPGP